MSATSGSAQGHHGFAPPGLRPDYKTYKSPHGPQYKISPNFHGINYRTVTKLGGSLAAFGGVLGFFVIFFAADVPKLRNDVMVKIPVIGSYWKREIAPEDNPF